MALEQNKRDFENALVRLADKMEELEEFLKDVHIEQCVQVIGEYNNHYKSNIEKLIEENKELQDKIDELEG